MGSDTRIEGIQCFGDTPPVSRTRRLSLSCTHVRRQASTRMHVGLPDMHDPASDTVATFKPTSKQLTPAANDEVLPS